VNFRSTGIFHRKALLKYLLFVLRQCVLCSSIILEFLTTSAHCITLKSPSPSRTITLELEERVRIFLRLPALRSVLTDLRSVDINFLLLCFTVSPCIFTHCPYWFQQMHYFNSTLVQCLSLKIYKYLNVTYYMFRSSFSGSFGYAAA
jgi:hypothetical protein